MPQPDLVTAGIVITALSTVSGFLGKLILDYISYLKSQVALSDQRTRDALASGASMSSALDRLTEELRRRSEERRS